MGPSYSDSFTKYGKSQQTRIYSATELHKRLQPYAGCSAKESLLQLLPTLLMFGVFYCLGYLAFQVSVFLALALTLPTAGFLVRLFIIQHDCSHGAFFVSRLANNVTGNLIGVLTLTPHACWRRFHSIHHAGNANLDRRGFGDVRMLTVDEYRRSSKREQWLYRLYRHPLVLFGLGPFVLFFFRQRLTGYMPADWHKERRELYLCNLTIITLYLVIVRIVGFERFLAFHIPMIAIASSVGVWLFYVQHQFPGSYWARTADWDPTVAAMQGSSYYALPKYLQWLTGHIGLHHIHHLNSRIPNYRLQSCFDDIEILRTARPLRLLESFACASLKLWDEERGEMVGFKTESNYSAQREMEHAE